MTVSDIKQRITPLLEEYGITYAGVFGSVARGEDTTDSDIDLIIRFGRPMGMFKYMRLIDGLESLLEKKVDLVTEKSLNKYVAPYVLPEVKKIYEK